MNTPFSLAAILPFCAKNDIRRYLLTPYRNDGYVVASDGAVAVRVLESLIAESVGEKAEGAPDISKLVEKYRLECAEVPGVLLPQDLPKPKPCVRCNGTGEAHECLACDGKGEFEHFDETYDCRTCGGIGTLPAGETYASPRAVECDECRGTGWDRNSGADIGLGHFALRYLHKLAALGEVRIFPRDDTKAAYFTFSHGDGVLMPLLRPWSET